MKSKSCSRPLLALLLIVLTLSALLFAPGCATTSSTASVENKAFAITRLVGSKVLKAHRDWRDEFTVARDDLKTLEAADLITLAEVLEIMNRLPIEQLQDGDTALYVETGVIFFSDELGVLAIKNPAQVRSAVTGMRRALDQVLK